MKAKRDDILLIINRAIYRAKKDQNDSNYYNKQIVIETLNKIKASIDRFEETRKK